MSNISLELAINTPEDDPFYGGEYPSTLAPFGNYGVFTTYLERKT